MNQSFIPEQHLMDLGGKAYLEVKWRLVWYRQACPNGTIDTEELAVDLDREVEKEVLVWDEEKRRKVKVMKKAQGYARYKAIVTDGKGGRATGTKSETAIDFPDFCEKAETGAIGRALAALGYGTQFAPELDEGERIVDAPVQRKTSEKPASISPRQNTSSPTQTVSASPGGENMVNNAMVDTLLAEYEALNPEYCGKNAGWKFKILRSVLQVATGPLPATYSDDDVHRMDLFVAERRKKGAA